ncbi:MAG: HNH endonuclease [Mariniphaga sp.]|nr:HNH endonuclease [Mariniphaga sp.]
MTEGYASKGATKEEMTTAVKSVRRKFKFKSIEIEQKDGFWYFDYEINPKGKKKGPKTAKSSNIFKAEKISSASFKGKFGDFPNWDGYPNPVTVHPSNSSIGYKSSKNVPKPTGEYEVAGSKTGGAPKSNRDNWRGLLNSKREGYKDEIRKSNPKLGKGQLEKEAKAMVEKEYSKFGLQWQELYLIDWEGHHIKSVNWGGSDSNSNLQYLEKSEHSNFTTWWTNKKSEILTVLKNE